MIDKLTSLKMLWGIRYVVFSVVCIALHYFYSAACSIVLIKDPYLTYGVLDSYFGAGYQSTAWLVLFVWIIGTIVCIVDYNYDKKKLKKESPDN